MRMPRPWNALGTVLLLAAAACSKDEFAPPPTPAGSAAAQQPPADPAPSFAADELARVAARAAADPAQPPVLELRCWTRDGRAVPDLSFDIYWQTDEGPSITAGKLGPDGWSRNGLPSGALIHSVKVRPTAYTAPRPVQVGQYAQPGRIVRVDALILPAAVVSGVVLDETGTPVPGAMLAGFHAVRSAVDSQERPAADNAGQSGEDGRFRLGGFAPGPFVLEAAQEGRMNVWRVTGQLAEGEEVGGVELLLEPAHTVHGQVLDPDGAPVRGARVVAGKPDRRTLTRPGPTPELVYVPARQAVTTTDEQGLFQLPLVPDAQEWNVNVDHARFRKWLGRIEAGQVDLIVRLERGLEARGSVLDAAGERLQGAAVVLLGGAKPAAAQTNRHGVFAIGGLDESAGRYLYISHPEHAPLLIGPVDLAGGKAIEARLGARESLHGRVTDHGAPVGGARLTLNFAELPAGFPEEAYPAELRSLQSGLSGADGSFEFAGIPAGLYRVEVSAADGRARVFDGLRTGAAAHALALD